MAPGAAAITVVVEEPMLSRLDRLDNIVKQLEEIIRGGGGGSLKYTMIRSSSPAKSSFESTHSSVSTLTSDGHPSSTSVDFSPRSLEKHCRPIDDVMMEVELKGNVLERLAHVEERVMKICTVELEKELGQREIINNEQSKGSRGELEVQLPAEIKTQSTPQGKKGVTKKGLKQLVKSCVKGKHKDSLKNNCLME